jgi:hypothetical protein
MTTHKIVSEADTSFDSFESMNSQEAQSTIYRFEIFKGVKTESGKIERIRSMGQATLRDGFNTYILQLKTLLEDRFYMLPCKEPQDKADFVILSRENARTSGKKYFWNVVGEGRALQAPNHGLIELKWDLFGEDVYMSIHPKKSFEAKVSNVSEIAS